VRILVTGGAGFVGSHLCDSLVARGDEVVCFDNLSTGTTGNIEHLRSTGSLTFVEGDVSAGPELSGRFDGIAHLACPASPDQYLKLPLETLAVGSHGSEWVLGLAERDDCRVVLASTSEVYGDPLEHPQRETYFGNVNPIGPRSVYDESKRFAEALFMAHRRTRQTDIGIVRIFNTYGPRLQARDGRVVSNFVAQALAGEPLTIYGDGSQTRSFCYVSDLVDGLIRMLASAETGPINLGNPIENTVRELAMTIIELTGSTSELTTKPLPEDDPALRRPDISKARELLGWQPTVDLRDGLLRTIAWQRELAASR
jgi:nucleoside-diphosphate-sugar epimerase